MQSVPLFHDRAARRRVGHSAALFGAFAAGLALMGMADAQETQSAMPLRLELNRLEPNGEACRTYLVIDNSRGTALKSLKVDLFAFDTDGIAQKRLGVELGPIPDRKTVVRLFDFSAIACPKIGRVLLNDVLACEGGQASRESCLERIQTESKSTAAFAR